MADILDHVIRAFGDNDFITSHSNRFAHLENSDWRGFIEVLISIYGDAPVSILCREFLDYGPHYNSYNTEHIWNYDEVVYENVDGIEDYRTITNYVQEVLESIYYNFRSLDQIADVNESDDNSDDDS